MTYWPAGSCAFPFFPGLTLAALPHYMHPPMAMTCYRRTPKPAALPKDFPDYLVYVTREALVATTTSLGKAFAETHDALLRVNQLFVCDRMMRSVFPAGIPGMPSWPANLAGFALQSAPAPRMTQPARPSATASATVPKPTSAPSASDLAGFASAASGATALNAVMSMAAAFLKFSPLMEPGKSAA